NGLLLGREHRAQSAVASTRHNFFPLPFPLHCRRENILGKNWVHRGMPHITHDKYPTGKAHQEFLSQSPPLAFIHYHFSLSYINVPPDRVYNTVHTPHHSNVQRNGENLACVLLKL